MPTYEYACAACGHEWDQVQRITEAPVDLCPKCGKTEAHRLISRGTNFILKGGGWYSDLYSSSKGTPKASTESSGDSAPKAESTSETKTESKAESKPAAATATAPTGSTSTPSTSSTSS